MNREPSQNQPQQQCLFPYRRAYMHTDTQPELTPGVRVISPFYGILPRTLKQSHISHFCQPTRKIEISEMREKHIKPNGRIINTRNKKNKGRWKLSQEQKKILCL